MVQPDCAAVIPPGPVSWYGVASPFADSGFAGTMMSQLTLAAAVVAGVVADGVAVAPPLAAAVGDAVPEAAAVGDAVPPPPCLPWPWPAALAGLAGTTYATAEAQLAFAA